MTAYATDEQQLITEILADPTDDAPRLIYADWLDEHADGECRRCHGGGTVGVSFLYKKGDPLVVEHRLPHGCTDCGGTGKKATGNAERAAFIRKSIEVGEEGENGWTLQPHIHHPQRDLFRVPGLTDGQYLYRKGFVSELRLTTAEFLGDDRECERCNGRTGSYEYPADDPTNRLMHGCHWIDCPVCHGTGRVGTPGVAATVFAAQPVTAVRLTDREPSEDQTGKGRQWIWHHDDDTERGGLAGGLANPSCLPISLFDLLENKQPAGSHWKRNYNRYSDAWYGSADLAHAALSAGCVKHGRRLVDPDGKVWPTKKSIRRPTVIYAETDE